MNKIEKIERIRLGSLEPKLITPEFVTRLSKLNKVCHHFHLSLQSGSTSVLQRMNRRYTAEEFRKAVRDLRKNFEDVILTADVIVGFPGETEEEFQETYNFLKEIRFYKIHVFKYSAREGTKAAGFPGQVLPQIKEERSKKIIKLSNDIQLEYNKSYIGKTVSVLVEEIVNNCFKGHTGNYLNVKIVNVDKGKDIENEIVNVKIIDTQNEILLGVFEKETL